MSDLECNNDNKSDKVIIVIIDNLSDNLTQLNNSSITYSCRLFSYVAS